MKKFLNFYNTELIEANSEKEFLEILKKLGNWPVLEGQSWNETDFEWQNTIKKFVDTGYSNSYFVYFDIVPDPKNNSYRMISVNRFKTLNYSKIAFIENFIFF